MHGRALASVCPFPNKVTPCFPVGQFPATGLGRGPQEMTMFSLCSLKFCRNSGGKRRVKQFLKHFGRKDSVLVQEDLVVIGVLLHLRVT